MISVSITDTLREEILSLKLPPATNLSLEELAERFRVSRSPVRDALRSLRDERLVVMIPQSGTRVAAIDLSQTGVERFLRTSLETNAAMRFCSLRSEKDLLRMEQCVRGQREAIESGDDTEFLELDNAFHRVIFEATGLSRLWAIIIRESGNYHRIRLLSFGQPGTTEDIIEKHKELVEAFRSGDSERAGHLERHHLGKLEAETKLLVRQFPTYFI